MVLFADGVKVDNCVNQTQCNLKCKVDSRYTLYQYQILNIYYDKSITVYQGYNTYCDDNNNNMYIWNIMLISSDFLY